jgi:hypothetical protein
VRFVPSVPRLLPSHLLDLGREVVLPALFLESVEQILTRGTG